MNEFEQHMKDQEEMEKEMIAKAREDMKTELVSKAQCMIDSYADVLQATGEMFGKSKAKKITDEEIAKRADMFWNISLQRLDRDEQENKRKFEQEQQMTTAMSGNPMPQNQPMPSGKSPCQERAERDAKIIEDLKNSKDLVVEAEIVK